MAQKSKLRDLLEFFILFLALYFLTQFALSKFFPQWFPSEEQRDQGIVLSMQDKTVKDGHHPIAILTNHTEQDFTLENRCPSAPFQVSKKQGDEFIIIESEENAVLCETPAVIAAGDRETIELSPWKYSLFSDFGTYRLELQLAEELQDNENLGTTKNQKPMPVIAQEATAGTNQKLLQTEFTVHQAGSLTKLFRAFITKPLLNLLILIASLSPGYSLGLAIVVLTILIKLLLFVPTQHALEGQKRMQAVQPKLEAVKQKYKDNPKKMQEETMKIWKTEKINPFQSCLPLLIQFPILIGLFFVIRDGAVLELSKHLIYGPYQNLDWTFGTDFLGLDLTVPSVIIMPPLLVVMQFVQMKLSFAIAEKKKAKKGDDKKKDTKPSQQQMQQRIMLYGLPIMIGVFAFQFPAAVSLYWGVSTVFAIGQQIVVNRKELK